MSIEAEGLEDWVGSEVVDAAGDKLGKVSEVYYRDRDPLIVEIRSGLIGRKYHLAALAGATVSMKHLRLSSNPIESDGVLDADTLKQLSAGDPRLANVVPDELESGSARKERLDAAREAAAQATELESEAEHRAEEAKLASQTARQAAQRADEAQQASTDAAEQARRARLHANELAGRDTAPATTDQDAAESTGEDPDAARPAAGTSASSELAEEA